jgi:hypothetical protein
MEIWIRIEAQAPQQFQDCILVCLPSLYELGGKAPILFVVIGVTDLHDALPEIEADLPVHRQLPRGAKRKSEQCSNGLSFVDFHFGSFGQPPDLLIAQNILYEAERSYGIPGRAVDNHHEVIGSGRVCGDVANLLERSVKSFLCEQARY